MRPALILGLLLVSSVALAGSISKLNPADGSVLPESVAKTLLDQCSRTSPQQVQGTWLPTPDQISELEARLPAALDEALGNQRNRFKQGYFRRQYVGFVIGQRKIIYVNAFPASAAEASPNVPESRHTFDWHNDAVIVCDGGPNYFGVEYDPSSKTFDHFAFNGFA